MLKHKPPWEAVFLAAMVAAMYVARLDAVPFRGEETRWARVAWEMRETGDYVVPRQQGEVFPDRPPLNSWCMLLAGAVVGDLDRAAVRLPAALATLLTSLLLYAYCRQFLTRWGALAAGLIYATFPQVLQLGRFAESDALFALLATASLLVWHTGYTRAWPRGWMWVAGYALAALAGLAKGPQGPVYFVAIVTVYLTLRRDWRCLFSTSHLAGLLAFAVVLGAWQVPFSLAAGSEATRAVWSEEGTLGHRVAGMLGPAWWRHLASYPAEVFFYLMPWSVFLFWYFRTGSRGSLAAIWPQVGFLLVCAAVMFPSCWLVTDARPRHVMSLLPCLACLIAVAIDRSCFDPSRPQWDRGFRAFLAAMAGTAAFLGAFLVISGLYPIWPQVAAFLPPSCATAAWGAGMLGLAAVCAGACRGWRPIHAAAGLVAVAAMLAGSFVVVGIDHLVRISDDLPLQVEHLKADVLRGERLVSLGPLFHKFTFYYRDPIEIVPWPKGQLANEPTWEYFCFMTHHERTHEKLPFAWQRVAVLYCDRAGESGVNHVCVGRRIVPSSKAKTAPRHEPAREL